MIRQQIEKVMTENNLKSSIQKLREQIDQAPDDFVNKQELEKLLAEMESELSGGNSDNSQEWIDEIRKLIDEFETEHPRVTAILNDIMVTLSNMGI